MTNKSFIVKDPCGCVVSAWFYSDAPEERPGTEALELGYYMLDRDIGQTVEVADTLTRIGVTVPGGCPHKND